MSLTDRHRAAAPPAPPQAPPGSSPRLADPPAKPYRHLVVIAAALAVLGVAGLIIVLAVHGPAGATPPTTAPTVSASPSASPTLSERQQAAADAQAAFANYRRALDELGNNGGSASAVRAAKSLSAGPEHRYIDAITKDYREQKIRGTGYSEVTSRVDSLSDLSEARPVAQLATCIDGRGRTATRDGKAITPLPFVQGTAELTRVDGRWLVTLQEAPEGQLPTRCSL